MAYFYNQRPYLLRRILKISAAVLLSVLILLCLTLAFVQTERGQNWLARQVTARLSRDLQARTSIDHVQIQFFNRLNLKGVLIEDRMKDTLLYAGVVQVNITDWFFLKDQADLEYIGLKDAVVNLTRTDSIWNYRFLQEYFSAPSSGKKKKAGISFSLKKILLDDVRFNQKDRWVGNDFFASVGNLSLDAKEITATGKRIFVDNLDLSDVIFQQLTYKGRRPPRPKIVKLGADTAAWNSAGWEVVVNRININNGLYQSDRDSIITKNTGLFNGAHLQFRNITGNIKNFSWRGDTVRAQVDLSTKERSGLTANKLQTALRIHPQMMEFDQLLLQTPRSILRNYFSMRFSSFSSMSDFINAVRMNANFENSSIASDDLALFAPALKDFNRNVRINGRVKGTVASLTGENVAVAVGNNSSLRGDFNLVGLPNINTTYINVQASDLRTTYADAVQFAPQLRRVQSPNLRALGAIRFAGTFTGFISDFVTFGNLQTALGNLRTDLNMKLPQNAVPQYSGSVSTSNFALGRFVNNKDLGAVAFNGNIKGKGFKLNELDLTVNGKIQKLHFRNYGYQNAVVQGRLTGKQFDGKLNLDDPNAKLSLDGLVFFGGNEPRFNMSADVRTLNLARLGFTKNDVVINGKFDLNFTGRSLSDLMGGVRISSATLLNNGRRLSFDSLIVSSTYSGNVRTLVARSNEFDATITGQFDLESLPDAVTLFLHRYYPSYIRPPRRNIPNEAFTFDIRTGMVDDYIGLLDKRLSGFNNSQIQGSLNVAANSLKLQADVPQFRFNQYEFSDVVLNGDGNFQRLLVNGSVGNAQISDSLRFPQTTFSISAQNDVSDVAINTTANQTINQASLAAQIKTFSNGASVLFSPSSFVLNGKTWTIQEGGELDFRTNTIPQGQVVLRESDQEITLYTQPSDIGNWSDLHADVKNLNLGDLSPFFLKRNRIEGFLNGAIRVEDVKNRADVLADLQTRELRLDADSIGSVGASLTYNNRTGLLIGSGSNQNDTQLINFDLALDFKDSANQHQDRITVQPTRYPVKILERFIGGLFSNLQGYLTGRLDIVGEGSNRNYIGKARLTDASLRVNFTQVNYRLDDTEIELTRDAVELGTLKLRDKDGATATVRGRISHQGFSNAYYDITADVDGRPMQLLNTTYKDNQTFYGRAKGLGSLILLGYQNDLNMYIEASPSTVDSSFITLPPSRSRTTTANAPFMVERKYGREMITGSSAGAGTNIRYNVNLTANPLVNVEVILDDLTGDVIRGRGTGNLQIQAGTTEPLSIRGRYEIQDGSYLFTFQTSVRKPFVLQPGGNNFIEWTGDPYTAQMNLEALYRAENVDFRPITSTFAVDRRLQGYRGDVNVIATLTGELFKPQFNFRLAFDQNSLAYSDPALAFGVQQIEKNTNEINKQVTFLIVFNSFAPLDAAPTAGSNVLNEFAYSTLSGMFFGEVNRRVNQILGKVLRNNEFTFNITGSLYNRNPLSNSSTSTSQGFNVNQGDVNLNIGKSLLSNRVILSVGGTVNVPIGSNPNPTIQQNIALFPDVNVDLLINKSGTVRMTFFYSQAPDLLSVGSAVGPQRRSGANLSYRKEFDSISEILFRRKKGRLKKDSVPATPTPPANITTRN